MSLGSDYIADHAGMLELQYEKIAKNAKSKIWTTKDGRKKHVETMSTQHIRNTLAWIERNDPLDILFPWVSVFMDELERRGEA